MAKYRSFTNQTNNITKVKTYGYLIILFALPWLGGAMYEALHSRGLSYTMAITCLASLAYLFLGVRLLSFKKPYHKFVLPMACLAILTYFFMFCFTLLAGINFMILHPGSVGSIVLPVLAVTSLLGVLVYAKAAIYFERDDVKKLFK